VIVYTALNPESVVREDPYLVINGKTLRITESHTNLHRAYHAQHILNDHERDNGRPEVYATVKRGDLTIHNWRDKP
jgi:hypothetical protein